MTIATDKGTVTLEAVNEKLRDQGVKLVLKVDADGVLHEAYTTAEVNNFEPSTYRPKSQIDR